VEQRISVITLGVADLARSLRFYEQLGWTRGNRDDGIAFFQIPGAVFALWPRQSLAEDAKVADHGGFGGITLAYNARSKADVDAVIAEAKAAGAKILKPAEDTFWGGYSGYFADPDGHPWEIAWNPHWPLDEAGGVSLSA
jgi:catechol 2,3-dioxygenase-like lactoylglutathione lyase family enzyme